MFFPDELPQGLPPLRGIEHRIDLIPGAPLPNRAPYRTNPEETKEIERQIQELLAKGHVRESLSPCAVPVILVPKQDDTLRMCMDCRPMNNITVRYRHPIPRLDDMPFVASVIPPHGHQIHCRWWQTWNHGGKPLRSRQCCYSPMI